MSRGWKQLSMRVSKTYSLTLWLFHMLRRPFRCSQESLRCHQHQRVILNANGVQTTDKTALYAGWRGAGAEVLSYQDTPPVRPCRLFLDVLSRKVLVRQYLHPSFDRTVVHLPETITLCLRTESRVCGTLLQDRTRQEAEYRAPQDVFERVLKKGTARPRLP